MFKDEGGFENSCGIISAFTLNLEPETFPLRCDFHFNQSKGLHTNRKRVAWSFIKWLLICDILA